MNNILIIIYDRDYLCFQAETIMPLSVSAKDHTDQADDTSLLRVVSLL